MMDKISDDHDLTEELYLRLILRFCGPAAQPSVQTQDGPILLPKTLADAVSATGDLYGRLPLAQDMVDLLKEKRVFLVGPPNTGKTQLLTLAGKKWITRGHEVHVFYGSVLPCKSLMHEFEKPRTSSAIKHSGKFETPKANIKHLNFDEEKEIDKALRNMKHEQNHYVIADDVDVDGKHFRDFCKSLKSKCPDVHLWATSSKGMATIDGWQVKTFTRPLNCPPAVVRECPLPETNYCVPDVKNEQHDNLYPTDGPPVKYIDHKKNDVNNSHDCKECGKEVGIFLTKHLITRHDKNVAEDDVLSGPSTANVTKLTSDKQFSVLKDKDLLVLFESGMKQEERFVEGLTESGIAVDFLTAKTNKDISVEETGSACAMHVDQLCRYTSRRKIVVYVESNSKLSDPSLKWRAMTSCTSQLIIVKRIC